MWGTSWIGMAHFMKFQQIRDTWFSPANSSWKAHSRYIAKSPATLDERGCPLQMHDVSGRATEPKLHHDMKFRGHIKNHGCQDKDSISDSHSQNEDIWCKAFPSERWRKEQRKLQHIKCGSKKWYYYFYYIYTIYCIKISYNQVNTAAESAPFFLDTNGLPCKGCLCCLHENFYVKHCTPLRGKCG